MSDTVDIDVEIRAITSLAIFVTDGDKTAWISKSQISNDYDEYSFRTEKSVTITMPKWLAKAKELI